MTQGTIKILIRSTGTIAVLTVLFSYVPIPFKFDSTFYNTVFTVLGIFYSIGYSIALGFDYSRIGNKDYAENIREAVRHVVRSFTSCLVIATVLFLSSNMLVCGDSPALRIIKYHFFQLSFPVFFAVSLLYCLFFLVFNFKRFQKLKDDLEDKIRADKED